MTLDAKIEKSRPAQWEEIATEEDWEDIRAMGAAHKKTLDKLRALVISSQNARGLLLREGKSISGLCLYSKLSKDTLQIKYLFLDDSVKNITVAPKLVKKLRAVAEEEHVQKIEWSPVTKRAREYSKRIAEKVPYSISTFTIPIDKLDVATLGKMNNQNKETL